MKILVVDDDPNLRRLIGYALQVENYSVITAENGREALDKTQTEQPDLIILDVAMPDMDGLEVCQQLRTEPGTAHLPIIMLSARTQVSDKILGLQAGADEYLTKPVDMDELIVRVTMLLQRRAQSGPTLAAQAGTAVGQIIPVYGPKGGVGRTTIAVNLAVALVKATEKRVVLVDGNGQLGDTGFVLGLRSDHTLLDLLSRVDEMDAELVNSVLVSHTSGVQVLMASGRIEANEAIQAEPLTKVLTMLQDMFDYVVIDTWPFLNEYTLAVLDSAEKIVLVTTPEISSLRNTRAFLDLSGALGYTPGLFLVTLNRYDSKSERTWQTIAKALKCDLAVRIPLDTALVKESLDRGMPVVIEHPQSSVAQSIFQLVEIIAATESTLRPTFNLWSQAKKLLSGAKLLLFL